MSNHWQTKAMYKTRRKSRNVFTCSSIKMFTIDTQFHLSPEVDKKITVSDRKNWQNTDAINEISGASVARSLLGGFDDNNINVRQLHSQKLELSTIKAPRNIRIYPRLPRILENEKEKLEILVPEADDRDGSPPPPYAPSTSSKGNVPEITFNTMNRDLENAEDTLYQRSPSGMNGVCTKYGTGNGDAFRSRSNSVTECHFSENTPLIARSTSRQDKRLSISDCTSENSDSSSESSHQSPVKKVLNYVKVIILSITMLVSVALFIMVPDTAPSFHQVSVDVEEPLYLTLPNKNAFPLVRASLKGKFLPHYYDNFSDVDVFVTLQKMGPSGNIKKNMSTWKQAFAPAMLWNEIPDTTVEHLFDLQEHQDDWVEYTYRLQISTNGRHSIPLAVSLSEAPRSIEYGVIFATLILAALYIIIVFDLIHRTLAAMWAGIVAMGVLALLNEKPSLNQVMGWMDIETLGLLFGMMVLVAILCETGFFDYVAVLAYKMAKGKRWTVITLMCFFTAIISAFLDNVTTILLFTPVTIRLCEVMQLEPKFVLIALVMFSNVGGTATAVGDPPNVIIVSNAEIAAKGIGFANFTLHMSLGSIAAMFVTYFVIRFMFRNVVALKNEEASEVVELRHEIQVWKRSAGSLSLYSRDENTVRKLLLQKVASLETLLKKKLYDTNPANENYESSLLELQKKYKITNFPLLIKTAIVMICVILLFFLHSIPAMNISLGWIAIIGAIFLLILADLNEIEHIFARVEWTTLVFFAALFAVMEALNELGLLKFIGTVTENFIKDIPQDMQLCVSIILIVWVSAIASSFIDNIPFTTVMVKIVLQIADNPDLNLPLQPLVWALAFGACFGGNGTLIGASANVVCAGVAEQHGYRFTFMEFFKIGFPIMLITTTVATAYLLICHVALDWNG